MNIVVRVDSSALIGSGHLMRCLAMAERQRKVGDKVIFVCRDLEGNISRIVAEFGFDLHLLQSRNVEQECLGYTKWLVVSQKQDASDTINVIKKFDKIDKLVVDNYAIDITWEKMLRPYVDEIMVIDDLANRCHDCDILLDQNFYLNKEKRYQGLVPEHCELLLGPKHALLREEFSLARKNLRLRDGILRHILVFYGGVDATDETSKAVKALAEMDISGLKVTVVVGAGNNRKETIADLCRQAGFTYYCQISNMAELMADADLMLGAGGSTTWERCYLGLPAIVTAVAANQWQICVDCAKAGLIFYLGHHDAVTVADICLAVRQFVMKRDLILDMQSKCLALMNKKSPD